MVDVYVGSQRRHWSVHRRLLCHHASSYSEDSDDNNLELPDDDSKAFELLVKWLYQGAIDDVSALESEEKKYECAVQCYKLWLLCDKLGIEALKDVAFEQYKRRLYEAQLVPDPDEICEIYGSSTSGSPFKRLMTRIAARQIMDPAVEKDAETYRSCFEGEGGGDFAVDMVNCIRYMSGGMLFEDPTAEGYREESKGSVANTSNEEAVHGSNAEQMSNTPAKLKDSDLVNGTSKQTNGAMKHNTPNTRSASYAHLPDTSGDRTTDTRDASASASASASSASSISRTPRKLEIRSYPNATNTRNGLNAKTAPKGPPSAQKPWTVNGMVRQLNGHGGDRSGPTSLTGSSSTASSSVSGMGDGRKRPPKLRRKDGEA